MAITFVRDGGTKDEAAAGTHTISTPAAGHAQGNLVAVFYAAGSDGGSTTVTDARSNTYTVEQFWDATSAVFILVAVSKLTTALVSGDLITIDPTNSVNCVAYAAEYTATNSFLSTVDGQNHSDLAFTGTWTSSTLTNSHTNAILLTGAGHTSSAVSNTPDGNSTERYDHQDTTPSNLHLIAQDRIVTAGGSYASGGTWSASTDGAQACIMVAEGAAGGPPGPSLRIVQSNLVW